MLTDRNAVPAYQITPRHQEHPRLVNIIRIECNLVNYWSTLDADLDHAPECAKHEIYAELAAITFWLNQAPEVKERIRYELLDGQRRSADAEMANHLDRLGKTVDLTPLERN
jgi:hypothetical protein